MKALDAWLRVRCAEFIEYVPRAHGCEQAATRHHFGEVVDYRLAAGVLGLVLLGVSVVATRRRFALMRTSHLPRGLRDVVATIAFAVSGIFLTAIGIDQTVRGHNGAGEALSAGIVATSAAFGFGSRLVRGSAEIRFR